MFQEIWMPLFTTLLRVITSNLHIALHKIRVHCVRVLRVDQYVDEHHRDCTDCKINYESTSLVLVLYILDITRIVFYIKRIQYLSIETNLSTYLLHTNSAYG